MKTKWRIIIVAAMLLLILCAIAAMLYPILSAKYMEKIQSELLSDYEEIVQVVEQENTGKTDQMLAEAQAYNAGLFSGEIDPLRPAEFGYYEKLALPNTAVMGYLRIPKIQVKLPIYHGIGDSALSKGVGHMPQSSLPVGGENTHTVLSAHTGMAGSPMFSDLPLMEEGDKFFIEILGKTLAYEVDQITVTVPQDVSNTRIQAGEDCATLVTCYPYGVNSHRLLVRGHRISYTEEKQEKAEVLHTEQKTEQTESIWVTEYFKSIAMGAGLAIPFLLICFIIMAVKRRKKREK